MLDKYQSRFKTLYSRATKQVDPLIRQKYTFESDIPYLGDYTNVFQLHLGIDTSWYQLLPDPMPYNKPLMFQPQESRYINQFRTFDTRRAGLYIPKQKQNFCNTIIHASASDTVLEKLTRTVLTPGNTDKNSQPGYLQRLLSLNERVPMDHLLTPSFLVDN